MDIVTVTCARDKHLMPLQSWSINCFVEDPSTHWIILDSHTESIAEWYDYLGKYYTHHQVKILPSLLPNEEWINQHNLNQYLQEKDWLWPGWIRQQMLKLLISNYIDNENYVFIDSDLFFFKSDNFSLWPEHGNGIVGNFEDSLSKNWISWVAGLYNLTNNVNLCLDSTIPLKLKTKLARDLSKLDLKKIFFDSVDPNVSEFVLYSWYAQTQGYTFKNNDCLNFLMWDHNHFQQSKKYYEKIKSVASTTTITADWRLFSVDTGSEFLSWIEEQGIDMSLVDLCIKRTN